MRSTCSHSTGHGLAQFSSDRDQRIDLLSKAISKNDVLKFMLYTLLELSGITDALFAKLSSCLEEAGRMVYAWKTRLEKENRPTHGRDGKLF